ncbi:MAG: hypothetical protein ACETV1_02930, partial [Candidatus Bathyarchaeia archaeon]
IAALALLGERENRELSLGSLCIFPPSLNDPNITQPRKNSYRDTVISGLRSNLLIGFSGVRLLFGSSSRRKTSTAFTFTVTCSPNALST